MDMKLNASAMHRFFYKILHEKSVPNNKYLYTHSGSKNSKRISHYFTTYNLEEVFMEPVIIGKKSNLKA